ncbi:MAG: DUF4384 domain-containing protein [Pyrinomonadaceae bacterium]
MRFKSAILLAALALLTLAAAHAQTQQQGQKDEPQQKDEKVIDDFVTTRGIIFDAPAPAKPKQSTRRRPGSGVASTKKSTPGGAKQGGATAGAVDAARQPAPSTTPTDATEPSSGAADGAQFVKASSNASRSLALGYTIYMKDASGALLPAQASRSYRTGDRIAIVLETNMDGYLYVFDAENGKNPVMLYPSVQLNGGSNEVRAHVRETYPSDLDLAFEFVDPPATEHLYVVVSREPLAGVPSGDALEKFCAKSRDDCQWRPTAAQWARISAAALDRRIVEARSTQIAQADTQPVMPSMLQRGIKLKKEEPAPSIVRVSDSPAARMLVTKIELAHK